MRTTPIVLAILMTVSFAPLLVPTASACAPITSCVPPPPCTALLGCPPNIWCNNLYCMYNPPCTYLLGCPVDPWCNPTWCFAL
jgi:hypothetical protein